MSSDARLIPGYVDAAAVDATAIDVLVVTWWTPAEWIERLIGGLLRYRAPQRLHLHLWDNSVDAQTQTRLESIVQSAADRLGGHSLHRSPRNLGFGNANNALMQRSRQDWVLLLNPDAVLDPGALEQALSVAVVDPATAAVEFRQRPYEHPKHYNPVTLETGWVSAAAVLLRRSAVEAIGGFDARLFLYGEDVDLSWRLRAAGHRLRYLPWASVLHESYAAPEQVKPQQTLGSTFANLCLRLRYGSAADLRSGLRQLTAEVFRPQDFPGRRRGLLLNLARFVRHYRHFARSRVAPSATFRPMFAGWDYEHRRKGAFWSAQAVGGLREDPLVSILIRTHRRPAFLYQALLSVARQTYRNIEAIIVEDGPALAQDMVMREFAGRISLRYHATGERIGRARAGNIALSMARGEWLNFLDDDDLLYADHVETLLNTLHGSELAGAYGVAWEVPTEVDSVDPLRYREGEPVVRYQMPFNHLTLWTHNYIPIQSAMFHRRLYETYGGFETDMDQLEDWNLWTRYTLADRFELVDKTTSLYRVPRKAEDSASRQAELDAAYRDALARQASLSVRLSPALLRAAMGRSSLIAPPAVTVGLRRQLMQRTPVLRTLLRWRDHMRGL